MSINWHHLRSWSGSQNGAFEELCCQLAAYETLPQGSKFVRKAPPDAGIECFWILPGGDEWGWQAKFFLSTPEDSQWGQMDVSLKTALDRHPRLTTYTICLPIDRHDPRIDQQKWFMDKWNGHVKKWEGWAHEKGMSVEFIYWGEHEIWERLSREEHRGRHFFWFNEESFSKRWFEGHIEEAISNAGPRYSPELNVDLPIARLFDGLGRKSEFFHRINVLYGELKTTHSKTRSRKVPEVVRDQFDSLEENITQLLSILQNIETAEMNLIDFGSVTTLAFKSRKVAWKCIQSLENFAEERKKEVASSRELEKQSQGQMSQNPPEDFGYEIRYLHDLTGRLGNLTSFAESNEARLANIPALLLVGEAGTGKTHLFCDIAKHRASLGLPTVLLLGGHFRNQEPWLQIISLTGLTCSREEFLGALEAAAQAQGSRALILIDALNEGEGKKIWDKYIAGMLTTLSRNPWIGMAVSVRTSYERTVIPDELIPARLVRDVHYGFADHEYQATRTFFDYYGIVRPSMPLLIPEFQNPLFLKLFCKALKNRNLTEMPTGLQGIVAIFNFFVESVNGKLSKPDYLNFDSRSQIVNKAVEKVAQMMADKGITWLPRGDAQEAIDALLPREGYDNSLFRHLISEGIFAEDIFWIEGGSKRCDGIRFSYERFADFLIAKYLLDKYLDSEHPLDSFLPDQPLGSLLKEEDLCWINRGLVEAFSIQLPELVKKELAELAPGCADFTPILEAFVNSLIWRDPTAINDSTLQYINKHVLQYKDIHDQFQDTLLTVASNPKHPYNAIFLHNNLMRFELAERDASWSIYLHDKYGRRDIVDRIIDWAWSNEDKGHMEDEPIRLCGIALAWFLTTSNRFLRDRATKALVNLFTSRINLLRQVIPQFLSVNDPYVLERLFAVAYGCALRSKDYEAIGNLAKDVYQWIFKDGTPPRHILLRDYARGCIELAFHRNGKLDIDVNKVRPPYKSELPESVPSEGELEKLYREKRGYYSIWNSLMYNFSGFPADFGNYVLNSSLGRWSSRRLNQPKVPSIKEIYEDFMANLNGAQKTLWDELNPPISIIDFLQIAGSGETRGAIKDAIERFNEERSKRGEIEIRFKELLTQGQLKTYEEVVIPYQSKPYQDKFRFDTGLAQRWIFQKVLDLGWTPELFGKFEKDVDRGYHRDAHKPERIGKKYQWIAYHEFLARVSDNFEFKSDSWSDRTEKYEGPWQVRRDIDPSFLLSKTERQEWKPHTNTWWFPSSYNLWESEPDDTTWLKSYEDLPRIEPLIEVAKPGDGSKWLVMETFYNWEQPVPPGEERYEVPRRQIWYMIKSYIVRKSDMEELFDWAKKQNFEGRWMPESDELYNVFLGEFFWAPAFEYHNIPYYYHSGWTRGHDKPIPKELLVSTDQYMQEGNVFDCSIDETVHIFLPTKWIADNMMLEWDGAEGQYFDEKNNLIAFDPSVRTSGPGALVINRDAFLKFLNDSGHDILWTILGEKNIIGGDMAHKEWKGRLGLSGAYRIRDNRIEGVVKTAFRSRD